MHRKIISCVICALIIASIFVIEIPKDVSAQIIEEWVARYDAANDGDYGNAIAIGPSGNIYVTGHSYIGDNSDYATVAYDPLGNELWTTRYNGPINSLDYSYDIIVDSTGNIYVTGKSHVTGEFEISEEIYDFTTVAYDSNGNQRWVAMYSGPGNGRDTASAMVISSNGNVYVTGASRGFSTNIDYATIAYDSLGNQLWVARYNGPLSDEDYPEGIIVDDSSGNIYVTGRSKGMSGYYDYATVAYDLSGNQLWASRYDGPANLNDYAYAITIGSSGNIYVTGSCGSGSPYYTKFATIAYDSSGNQLWVARSMTVNENDYAYDIALDIYGNVYVTGGRTRGGPDYDYLTIAYDSSGVELWKASYNGLYNGYDRASDIALDPYGNVFVTGRSKSGPSSAEYATIGYDSDGNQFLVARYHGPGSGGGEARDIVVDLQGNVYVTGYNEGLGTGPDMTTIKYSRPTIQATIDIDPNTLNLKSKGRWITCYIDLPEGYDVNDIDISTIMLEDTIPAEWGDVQGTTLMVKFDRSEVEDYIGMPQESIELTVTGEFFDGSQFEGSDNIRVINPP